MKKELWKIYKKIADEAIVLADEYSGGESETLDCLKKEFEKAEILENKEKDNA